MDNTTCGCLGCVEDRSSDHVSMMARGDGGVYLLPGDHGAAARCLAVYPNHAAAEAAMKRWNNTTERLVAATAPRTDHDPIDRACNGLQEDVDVLTNAAVTLGAVETPEERQEREHERWLKLNAEFPGGKDVALSERDDDGGEE